MSNHALFLTVTSMTWLLAACGGATHKPRAATPPPTRHLAPPRAIPTAPALAAEDPPGTSPPEAPTGTLTQRSGIRFRGVSFDSRTHRLRVVDQPDGPGSSYPHAASVAASLHPLAVTNGGFFTPDGSPLGRLVSEGNAAGSWNSSSLGSGIWLETQTGASSIHRRSFARTESVSNARNLLQAGPLLLERGKPVAGLEPQKQSARTFLLWDGRHRWWLGISSPVSLAELASTLASRPPTSWQPATALNLDGGRSSEIWLSAAISGQTTHHRPAWNRPVRNFLVLLPRNGAL